MNDIISATRLELIAIGIGPTALLAFLGFLFKEKWKQLLAQSLAERTEQIRLKAQRDIEAYKVSLIAEVEREKALADLSKAMAIKHQMLEYEALVALHEKLRHVPPGVLARAKVYFGTALCEPVRSEKYAEAIALCEELEAAHSRASIFLGGPENAFLLELIMWLRELQHEHMKAGGQAYAGAGNPHAEAIAGLLQLVERRVGQMVQLSKDQAGPT